MKCRLCVGESSGRSNDLRHVSSAIQSCAATCSGSPIDNNADAPRSREKELLRWRLASSVLSGEVKATFTKAIRFWAGVTYSSTYLARIYDCVVDGEGYHRVSVLVPTLILLK